MAWNWLQRYRVWQANRKVFLSPENYLEPELRDDGTPPPVRRSRLRRPRRVKHDPDK